MSRKDNRPAAGGIGEEDLKIAEEMVKEGKTLPPDLKAAWDAHVKASDASASHGAQKTQAELDAEAADKKKADDVLAQAKATADAEAAAAAADAGKDGKHDQGGNGEPSQPPAPRGVKTVPLAKYLESERQRKVAEDAKAALETQLKDLPNESSADYEKKIEALAVKLGLEVEAVKELDTFFSERHKLPDDVLKAITETRQMRENESFWDKQNERFASEFAADLTDLKKSDPNEATLMEQNKEKIQELAFTDGYNTKSTWELWTRYVKPSLEPNRKTVENPGAGSGGGSGGGSRNWAEIAKDPAKIKALSKADFDLFDKWMTENDGSSRVRHGKKV